MKILLIEDNQRLASRLIERLHKYYTTDHASNGQEGLRMAKSITYGVVILDLGLPDMSGMSVCSQLRDVTTSPILILTGLQDVATKVKLLEAGADDFITKPFNLEELRARIDAISRRQSRPLMRRQLTHKDLVLDSERRSVTRAGHPITLRRKEFEILEYLLMNKGRIMTREMIMNHVWSSDSTSWKSTIDVHVKHLRDKVDTPYEDRYIKTVYGLGYRIE